MKKSLLLILTLFLPFFVYSQTVFINEIHYDNNGADSGEGVEIAGPAGTDLSTYSIVAYNGNGGISYNTVALSGTITDQQNGYGTVWFAISGLQNGAPDGMALVNNGTTVVQFLSYEGSFGAADGPASGMTSVDIGVAEAGTEAIGSSLQLSGTGNVYTDFTWQGSATATINTVNTGQTFSASGPDTDPPVWALNSPTATFVVDTTMGLGVEIDEPGKAYYIVVADGSTAPTSAEVKAGVDYTGGTVLQSGSIDIPVANTEYVAIISGLTVSTAYDVFVVAEDDETSPNLQATPAMLDITTTALRQLNITAPIGPGNYNIGDTIHITWTSGNIDSLFVAVYNYLADEVIPITTDENGIPVPIAASTGAFDLWIPHDAEEGDYDVRLYDAVDTSYYDSEGPFTVADNRAVAFVKPQENDIYYLGDTVVFEWTHTDLDSILLGSYIYEEDMLMIITMNEQTGEPEPLDANRDTFSLVIPLGTPVDSAGLIIFDYYDTSFNAGPVKVYLIDTIRPRIMETLPVNGDTDVPVRASFFVEFTEWIMAGTGKIYLREADGTLVEEFDTGSVILNYNNMKVTPSQPLVPGTTYYVEMDAGFVKDRKDLIFGGISGSNVWSFTAASADLYFSEYIEGSVGSNKALELYNPTAETIDLSEYRLWQVSNGGTWYKYTINLSGTLPPLEVFVVANPSADAEILAVADMTSTVYHNGDDAQGLVRYYGDEWVLIDAIGREGVDPGTGWDVAGVTNATKDHTLIRKITVNMGDTTWTSIAGTNETDSEWMVFPDMFFSNLGSPSPQGSDQAEFTSFVLKDTIGNNVTVSADIDSVAATINVEILFGMDSQKDSLVAVFSLSAGATASPKSGDTLDFTNPVVFSVTAEDGLTTKTWTVTVTVSSAASTATEITSFTIPGAIGEIRIASGPDSVTVVMPYGTDLAALTPTIEVSAGAAINPLSGVVQDFTNPVVYTVTAQDGTTTKDWTVTVVWEVVTSEDIYSIQYTTDPSGDSPLKDQKVKVSGVITALNIFQSQLKGYYIQDADSAWSGVYVYDQDRDLTDNPQLGDSVTVVGIVEEYYNLTEIGFVQYYKHEKTGVAIPGPVEVATGNANQEKWESVFMRFVGAEVIANDLGFDEVEVNDGSGASRIDDRLYNYTASTDFVVGNIYHIVGVMYYSYGNYKLLPRSVNDISDVTNILVVGSEPDFRVYPNPSEGQFSIEISSDLEGNNLDLRIATITGKVVYANQLQNAQGRRILIDLSGQPSGFYFIRISNGTQSVVKKMVIR